MNARNQWNVYRTRFLVEARQLTEPLVFIDALGREQRGSPGDYLVESRDGFRSIAPRMIFEDVYVPLEAPQFRSGSGPQAPTDEHGRTVRPEAGIAAHRLPATA